MTVTGDQTVGADSLFACAVRVLPADVADRAGTVVGCTDPVSSPPVLELALPPGEHRVQAVRSACPGMPGDCADDPWADQYDPGSAVWACEAEVAVAPRSSTPVRVDVTTDPPRAVCTAG